MRYIHIHESNNRFNVLLNFITLLRLLTQALNLPKSRTTGPRWANETTISVVFSIYITWFWNTCTYIYNTLHSWPNILYMKGTLCLIITLPHYLRVYSEVPKMFDFFGVYFGVEFYVIILDQYCPGTKYL